MIYLLRKQTYATFFILLLLATACGNNQVDSKPQPAIEDSTMAQLLTDMHLIDAITTTNVVVTNDSLNILRKSLYEAIYKKFGVDEQTFKANFEYYKQQPQLMDSIYTQVITNLMKMEEAVPSQFNF
jgi:hypothetical protein